MPAIDVTDATFETEVIDRSARRCPSSSTSGPSGAGRARPSGPILEKVVDETDGKVVLAKVDVDDNPRIGQAFQVQSIPAVFAPRDGKVVRASSAPSPSAVVRQFVESLLPTEQEDELDALLEAGDEASLRQALELEPGHEGAIVALAELLVRSGDERGRRGAGPARAHPRDGRDPPGRRARPHGRRRLADVDDDVEARLDALLDRVKDDDEARQEFLDLLELLGPDDPRTAAYRKQLTVPTVLMGPG